MLDSLELTPERQSQLVVALEKVWREGESLALGRIGISVDMEKATGVAGKVFKISTAHIGVGNCIAFSAAGTLYKEYILEQEKLEIEVRELCQIITR